MDDRFDHRKHPEKTHRGRSTSRGREQVEGKNPVCEALRGPRDVHAVFLSDALESSGTVDSIRALAESRGVEVREVPREQVERMAATAAPQGVVARVSPYRYFELEEIVAGAKGKAPLLLALDGVEDPQNLGSMLRVAEATAVDGVVMTKKRAASVGPAVASASAGAVEHVRIARVPNMAGALETLKGEGLWVAGADGGATSSYDTLDMTLPLVLVLGGEGRGLSRLVGERCDFLVRIPMLGQVSSLNVSTAAAVLLYEALRQRSGGPRSPAS